MVMAMMTAANTQPAAIHRPPNTIQSTLRINETSDMARLHRDGSHELPLSSRQNKATRSLAAPMRPTPLRTPGCRIFARIADIGFGGRAFRRHHVGHHL